MTPREAEGLQQRLAAMEEESIRWMRTNVARVQTISADMMQLAAGAGPEARALALRVHGNALRLEGRVQDALAALTASQRLWREAGNEAEWARTVTTAIPVWVQLERYTEAVRMSEAALERLQAGGELAAAVRLLNNMGSLYGHLGRLQAALRTFAKGEELAAQIGQTALGARFASNRALVLQQMGRHTESLTACARALRFYRKTDERVTVAKVRRTAAIGLFHMGRFGKALQRFAAARAAFETNAAPRDVAVCDLYIAGCYLELNRLEQTISRVHMALAVLDPAQAAFEHAWGRLSEGTALGRLGRQQEGLGLLRDAHRWFAAHGHGAWAGKAKLEEAEAQLSGGSVGEAIRAARAAARLFQQVHMPVEAARALLLVAESCRRQGRLAEAAKAAAQAYPAFRRSRMPAPAFRTLHLLGRIALERREWEQARRLLTRAVATAEHMRSTVQLSFRRAFLDDKSAAYADLVWLHLMQGRTGVAHRLADQAKSRALVDALAAPARTRRELTSPADLPLLSEIQAMRRQYQTLLSGAQVGPEVPVSVRGGAATLTEERWRTEQRLAALWDEWELRHVASLSLPGGRAPSPAEALRQLPPGGRMVEYFVTDHGMAAFVSDRRGLRGWVSLGPADPVRQALQLLQLNLDSALTMTAGGRGLPAGLGRNAVALLNDLHQMLWAPLGPLLGECRQVAVVPHGILHLVPYEALFDGDRYLVELAELSLAPSRAAWARCAREDRQHPAGARDVVIGFDPGGMLPYAEDEARQIARALGAVPLTGSAATTAAVAAAGPVRILHVAVHGEFRSDNPYFSSLLLHDGPLTVADAAGLKLDASLAVLSGCETGLSRITRGEELMGMISAFLQAGCVSVLASRWRVDDRVTAELMQRFYRGLLSGRPKGAALREAQAAMAAQGVHPVFWAAFGLVGDRGPLNDTLQRRSADAASAHGG